MTDNRAYPALKPLTHDSLSPHPHGFFTRLGGVSTGIYESLNTGRGSDDETGAVAENRRRVCAHLGARVLVTPHQVHSAKAVYIKDAEDDMPAIEADALVSDRPGIGLGVLAADCAPVLLADPQAGVIGAAHAGWRGAFDNILKACVEAMAEIGATPAHMRAVIGPAISVRSYEVGEDFVANFAERYLTDTDLFVPGAKEGHAYFNLPVFVQRQLARCGVSAEIMDICTYESADLLFSYRRATHLGESDYGRQISAIALPMTDD